ncbi:MAG: c-type cytochrome, partial [Chromatocurvus sp.]
MKTAVMAWLLPLAVAGSVVAAAADDSLGAAELEQAAGLYQQYCALCHGEDRAGYQADHAPSLKSQSLLSTGYPRFMYTTIAYGRANTAMEGYSTEMGGPLDRDQIRLLLRWLVEVEAVEPVALDHDAAIAGDAAQGAGLYAEHCASCHGADGQGISAPSLGDPA